ncbi:MAG: peptidase M17, partial [Micromonospora sp.]
MLAIRLVSGPERPDTLVLPLRSAGSAEDPDAPAALVPTTPALPGDVLTEATALVRAARLTGRAGEVREHLRLGGSPTRLLLLGVG